MEDPHRWPAIYGQLLLAILILINSVFSWWQKKKIELRDQQREEREAARQEEIATNLAMSQRLVMEHGELLSAKIEKIHHELGINTQVNIDALEKANGFNEKIAQIVEKQVTAVHQVEIVQPPEHPILIHEVNADHADVGSSPQSQRHSDKA